MKENLERKIGQPENIQKPELKTAPKSSIIGPIVVGIAAAVCVTAAPKKEAHAEPVTWKIGVPFGDDINGVTETTFRGITPGEKPNRFRLTYTREPTDISANKYVYDKWIEIDDGPDDAVVVRELGKAEYTTEYPNPQYGYYGHPENNLEYCIDGVTYKIEGFPASLQQEKNGILVNGESVWNPYPYPDGLDSDAVIDFVTRSADPTKISVFAGPFFPNGDWLNYDGYYSWKISVLEKDFYDAIQKAIDKAWKEGKNPYEAGLANPLDDTKGSLYASPETDKLLAMTRWKGYGPLDNWTRTYFFSGNPIANQYVPLQRDNNGTWLMEGDTAVNGGLGEADFIDYGNSCDTENTPVGALSRETPQGGKEHIFIIEHCGTVGTLILKEQPDNLFTEPTLIHEEDSNVDVSGENVLCVDSTPLPKADAGPEQVEQNIVEQPIVAEETTTATAEKNTGTELPATTEPTQTAEQPEPVVAELPLPPAEPMPDVNSSNPEPDVKAETVEETGIFVPQEPMPEPKPEPTAEPMPDAISVSPDADAAITSTEIDGAVYVDILEQNPDTPPAGTDTLPDTPAGSDTSPDTPQNPDTQPDSQLIETQPPQDSAPDIKDTAKPNQKDASLINTDSATGTDTPVQSKDTQLGTPDASQSQENEGSGGCNCNTVNDSNNSAPVTSISALILALASRLRRKSLPTIDR